MKRICWTLLLAASLGLGACGKSGQAPPSPLDRAYDVEPDWNDAQHLIALNYTQAQGKRLFYTYCVWCHADATPARHPTAPTLIRSLHWRMTGPS